MASGIRIKVNNRGMAELLNSSEVREDLTERAQRVLAAAKSSAPVDTGEYVNGLQIEQATTDRAGVHVGSSAPHAWIVEARDGILVAALDAAGGS